MGASKKMSQAMRDGCKKKPQIPGALYMNGGTCALGAALDGEYGLEPKDCLSSKFFPDESAYYKLIEETWPVATLRVSCPCEDKYCAFKKPCVRLIDDKTGKLLKGPDGKDLPLVHRDVLDLIPHLNDSCSWTRERIADWLETVEATLEPKVVNKLAHMSNKEILAEILGPEPVSVSDLLKELLDRKEQVVLQAHKTH